MSCELVDVIYKYTVDGQTLYSREKGTLIGKDTIAIATSPMQVCDAEYNQLYRGYFIDLDLKGRKPLFEIASIAGVCDEQGMFKLIAGNSDAADSLYRLARTKWTKGTITD
ncbi:MAG: hypothetical protein ACE3JK_01530 [Sporolactobacillus sp.]